MFFLFKGVRHLPCQPVAINAHQPLRILNSGIPPCVLNALCHPNILIRNGHLSIFTQYKVPQSLKAKINFTFICPILLNWFSMLPTEQEVEIHAVKMRTSRQPPCAVAARVRRVVQPLYLPTEVPMNSNTIQ